MSTNLPSDLDIPANAAFGKPVLDKAFSYIVNRFLLIESFKPSYQAAIDQLNNVGLNRINAAIQPIYQRLVGFAQLGAIFSTTSTSSVTIAQGTATFVIAATDAAAFAAAAYIGVQHRGDTTNYMSGRLSSYDRDTGTLVLAIDNTGGSGTFSDWIISASVEPPTSLDVGAALTAQLNTFEALVNGEITTLQSNVNAQVASKAPLQSPSFSGTPTTVDPGTNDNTGMIPTTRWVQALIAKVNAAIANVQSIVGVPVRADASQNLTATQQATARYNISGAANGANNDITALGKTLTTTIYSSGLTGIGQFQAIAGNYGVGFRNDGNDFYMMQTASGQSTGTWNSFRPFRWNLTTGSLYLDGTGAGTNFGGRVNLLSGSGAGALIATTANGAVTSTTRLYDDGNGHLESSVTLWLNQNGGSVNIGNSSMVIPAGGGSITMNARPTWAGVTPYDTGNLNKAQVCNILGYYPAINYAGTNHSIGFGWDGTNVLPIIDGNTALGVLWGQTNLTGGQIGNILGYTPGRSTTPFAASSSGAGDLPGGSTAVTTSCSFTATGTSAMIVGNAKTYNNSGGGAVEVQIYIDLYDNTSGGVLQQGVQESCNVTYGQGLSVLSCHLVIGGLTVGHSYTARLWMGKGSTAGVTPIQNCVIGGFNS